MTATTTEIGPGGGGREAPAPPAQGSGSPPAPPPPPRPGPRPWILGLLKHKWALGAASFGAIWLFTLVWNATLTVVPVPTTLLGGEDRPGWLATLRDDFVVAGNEALHPDPTPSAYSDLPVWLWSEWFHYGLAIGESAPRLHRPLELPPFKPLGVEVPADVGPSRRGRNWVPSRVDYPPAAGAAGDAVRQVRWTFNGRPHPALAPTGDGKGEGGIVVAWLQPDRDDVQDWKPGWVCQAVEAALAYDAPAQVLVWQVAHRRFADARAAFRRIPWIPGRPPRRPAASRAVTAIPFYLDPKVGLQDLDTALELLAESVLGVPPERLEGPPPGADLPREVEAGWLWATDRTLPAAGPVYRAPACHLADLHARLAGHLAEGVDEAGRARDQGTALAAGWAELCVALGRPPPAAGAPDSRIRELGTWAARLGGLHLGLAGTLAALGRPDPEGREWGRSDYAALARAERAFGGALASLAPALGPQTPSPASLAPADPARDLASGPPESHAHAAWVWGRVASARCDLTRDWRRDELVTAVGLLQGWSRDLGGVGLEPADWLAIERRLCHLTPGPEAGEAARRSWENAVRAAERHAHRPAPGAFGGDECRMGEPMTEVQDEGVRPSCTDPDPRPYFAALHEAGYVEACGADRAP
ncbi:hypothetical protein L6R50_18620 [Myxococcota bacterium]|nr:hypothetical protein [Myxococcota bacterium]